MSDKSRRPKMNKQIYLDCLVSRAREKLKEYKKARAEQISHLFIDSKGYLYYSSAQEELNLRVNRIEKELVKALKDMEDFRKQMESEKKKCK